MKANFKNLCVVSCLSLAVCSVVIAVFRTNGQQSPQEYKVGRVSLEELASIVGGNGESQNCFVEPTDTCANSRDNQSSCVAGHDDGTTLFKACVSTIWREYSNNATGVHRSKKEYEQPNTLGFNFPVVNCYYEYRLISERVNGGHYFGGSYCVTENNTCDKNMNVPFDHDCQSCTKGLQISETPTTVNSAACSDP
jgi:hypothetical protein